MTDIKIFVTAISVIFCLGFLLPMIWRDQKVSTLSLWLALAGSVLGAVVSGMMWLGFIELPARFFIDLNLWDGIAQGFPGVSMPSLQTEFLFDYLSAFFVFLVAAFSAVVSVYSFGALDAPHYRRYRSRIASAFNLFIWATVMVMIAHDIFSLILTLEISSLALAYLALYKHTLYQDEENTDLVSDEKQKNARIAPQVYLALSHTSTAFLTIVLIILAILANSTSFDWLILSGRYNPLLSVNFPISSLIFLLALVGLGIRAGLTPAHIWPPLVHPAAPITLHTLFTGIGIKVAIYLMYRFFFQFLQPQAWWGYLLLGLAVLTAVVNVWYAISSHDLKTALAYHSVENIGIICAGIGIGIIFWYTNRFIAILGLIASLYHVLNHAVFKGLLFLATGAIDNLTHQVVEFDRLGGLIKRYGCTSAMFLIGSFSIAGFPPFNGFISEWLTLQALFNSLTEKTIPFVGLVVILLSLVLLVASFALTAFCFYKMAGVTLLGLPRSPQSERENWEPKDVPRTMKSMMALLAGCCLFLGLTPGWMTPLLGLTLKPIGIAELNFSSKWPDLSLIMTTPVVNLPIVPITVNLPVVPTTVNLPVVLMTVNLPILPMIGLALALLAIPWLVNMRRKVLHPDSVWNSGAPIAEPPVHQLSSAATSFLFHDLFALPALDKILNQIPDYLPAHISISPSARSPQRVEFFSAVYNFLIHNTLNFSEKFGHWAQNRDIRRYLWYIFGANLIALLVFILIKISGGK
jgi:hydrogenase-4 component B